MSTIVIVVLESSANKISKRTMAPLIRQEYRERRSTTQSATITRHKLDYSRSLDADWAI